MPFSGATAHGAKGGGFGGVAGAADEAGGVGQPVVAPGDTHEAADRDVAAGGIDAAEGADVVEPASADAASAFVTAPDAIAAGGSPCASAATVQQVTNATTHHRNTVPPDVPDGQNAEPQVAPPANQPKTLL
ncbi:hypothetical protein [Paraburkholderia phosphatilytica]|uniref:hypothetical protein n=1 Tax=Paraburkholderia phosphatilytica TaxID=2282883 RepID=UPI001F0B8C40|nr:hypothetical protein [Paraburkholderia phosphatilytica]